MVLESVALGVAAAFGWGAADFVAALVSRRLGVLRTAFGVHVVSVTVVGLYLPVALSLAEPTAAQVGLIAGVAVVGFAAYLAFYRALVLGPVAIVSPIIASYAVVVILLSTVLLDERLSILQTLAVIAGIGGVGLASVNPAGIRHGRELISAGLALAILAALGIGLWQFVMGTMSRELGWFIPIFLTRVVILLLLVPAVTAARRWPWQGLTRAMVVGVAVAAIVETGGLFAFARGAEIGIIPVVAGASTLYPVIPILGGIFVFRERISWAQGAGIVLALVGLLLLAVGGRV